MVLLLARDDSLTATSVATRLKAMAADETDPARLEAIMLALGEVQAELSRSCQSREAPALAFNASQPPGRSRDIQSAQAARAASSFDPASCAIARLS